MNFACLVVEKYFLFFRIKEMTIPTIQENLSFMIISNINSYHCINQHIL